MYGNSSADTTHYERFLQEKLHRIQDIRHTRSTFSLRTLKLVTSADALLDNASV
ncbi:Lrp/AsnC ligand binding domain-containing protein [Bradyrhizobium sp. AUGA SZCCT0283]|uniref:Lrp/AsnC ligand binding domain-containing protein n=1 Tax=Bradyrhizobium sp. AUGA SZCCT0283 TaxID=2807671 RepID=UPI001BAB5A8A|nr:Lrp/AsnC ligand binding domain-containing protein [Bradyrhizobium sp. AUGA SZCCT0283]MBR1276816.1 Lrp/AsnC ligand binding domain-containing protein [Bradyrhizobium sp. AUGA SZCCT0283]